VKVRRVVRIAGTLVLVAGLLLVTWGAVIWRWQDPVTALVTRYEQSRLRDDFEERIALYRRQQQALTAKTVEAAGKAAMKRKIAAEARRYRLGTHEGETLGRLRIPRLGLNIIVVEGTGSGTLKKGPGHDRRTFLPGEGKLVYIAGHRTTYGAPFGHIDDLRPGDQVTLELPYATYRYRISKHRIVKADQLEVLRSRGREELALQACWPRFFASHRYIAYAQPVAVTPAG